MPPQIDLELRQLSLRVSLAGEREARRAEGTTERMFKPADNKMCRGDAAGLPLEMEERGDAANQPTANQERNGTPGRETDLRAKRDPSYQAEGLPLEMDERGDATNHHTANEERNGNPGRETDLRAKRNPSYQYRFDFFTKMLQGSLFRKFRSVLLGHAHISSLCYHATIYGGKRGACWK